MAGFLFEDEQAYLVEGTLLVASPLPTPVQVASIGALFAQSCIAPLQLFSIIAMGSIEGISEVL
jgi:hypothetical protein